MIKNLGHYTYDNMEFFEFIWLYEELCEDRKRENRAAQEKEGQMSLKNLGGAMMNNNPMQ